MDKNLETTQKSIIAVDIDDVIAAHAPAFIEYSNKKYGTNLTINDYQGDHWDKIWKVDHDEAVKRSDEYHDSNYIATYGIIEGAFETLKQLKPYFKLVILTTRQNSINQLTKDWIDKYYPDIFDNIVFAGFFDSFTKDSVNMTKADLVKSVGADYLIDDQLKHVLTAAEIGIESLLFGDYPWNQTDKLPHNVIRVKNWQEVLEFFDAVHRSYQT